jgi:hypothetical protein
MTQDILNDMDSDPVDTITDTAESEQVAQIIKTTYFNIVTQRDWPFLRTLTTLTATSASTPTVMTIPATVNKLHWIKYRNVDVSYLEPKKFHDLIKARDVDDAEVDANGYYLDRDPSYWTTYDDALVTFDAYDDDVETYLATTTSTIYITRIPVWTHTGASTPLYIPEKMFPTLLAAAKATCFAKLKQVASPGDESLASRGMVRMQNEAHKTKDAESKSTRVNYGRK